MPRLAKINYLYFLSVRCISHMFIEYPAYSNGMLFREFFASSIMR